MDSDDTILMHQQTASIKPANLFTDYPAKAGGSRAGLKTAPPFRRRNRSNRRESPATGRVWRRRLLQAGCPVKAETDLAGAPSAGDCPLGGASRMSRINRATCCG